MGRFTQTLSVTSGKGGVGKSTLVANLAYSFSKRGERVLLLDGDLGMANLDIMFGARSTWTIEEVLKGERRMEEILVPVAKNIDLIPGGSGIYGLHRLSATDRVHLIDQMNHVGSQYDRLIIDTAPGIDDHVLYLNSAAQEILVVLTPDPSSLTDAYALIKVLNMRHKETKFSVVANLVRDEQEGLRIFKALSDVAQQFLCVSLAYKGSVPMDLTLRKANRMQQMCVEAFPRSGASFAIQSLVDKLSRKDPPIEAKGGIQFFWQQMVGLA